MTTIGVCTGQCCAAFPLSTDRDRIAALGDDSGEFALIGSMVFELTHEEATARLDALSLPVPGFVDGGDRHLYSCRHWNTTNRRCMIYERRPRMCSNYPYNAACQYCGYKHPDLYVDPDAEAVPAT